MGKSKFILIFLLIISFIIYSQYTTAIASVQQNNYTFYYNTSTSNKLPWTVFNRTNQGLSVPPADTEALDGANLTTCITNNLAQSDDSRCAITDSGGTANSEPWIRFNFTINEQNDNITSIRIILEADNSGTVAEATNFVQYNRTGETTGVWSLWAAASTTEVTREMTYLNQYDIQQVLSNITNQTILLAEGTANDDGEQVIVDFVQVVVNVTNYTIINSDASFTFGPQLNSTNGENQTSRNLTVVWIATDAENSTLSFNVTWFKNNITNFTTTSVNHPRDILNVTILNQDNLTVGDTWIAMVNLFDGEFITRANTTELLILSTPSPPNNFTPIINSTTLLQLNLTIEDLQVRFNVSDPNVADTLTYNITWFTNNITNFTLSGISVSNPGTAVETLTHTNTTKWQNWSAQVIVCDNSNLCSNFINTSALFIRNSNATITTPAFNQTSYTDVQIINASLVFSDNDQDSNNVTFEWFKNNALIRRFTTNNYINGSNVSDILTTDNFAANDQIIVQAFAFDSEQNSTLLNSSTLTIQASTQIPGLSNLIINSTFQSQTNLTDETIQVRFNASDPDVADTLTYSIQWFTNNRSNFTLSGISVSNPGIAIENLQPANTTKWQNWSAQVRVCDNNNACSDYFNTTALFIRNSNATITTPAFNQSSHTRNQNVNISLLVTDKDGTDLNNITFEWFRNNISIRRITNLNLANNTNTTDTLNGYTLTKGQTIRVQAFAFDSEQNSTLLNSSELLISNSAPSFLVNPSINSTNGINTTEQNLNIFFTANDTDADSITYTIQYFTNNISNFTLSGVSANLNVITINLLQHTNISRGQTWKAQVQLSDGTETSSYVNTSELLILNTNPSFTTGYPQINSTDGTNQTTKNLAIVFRAIDIDENDILRFNLTVYTNNRSNFTLNGRTYSNGTLNYDTIDYRNLTKGQTWKAMITVYDNINVSYANTSELLILNTPPAFQVNPIINSTNGLNLTNIDLNIFFTPNETDVNDRINYSIMLFKNNRTNFTSYNIATTNGTFTNFIVNNANTTKGDAWRAQVWIFDGTSNSTLINTTELLILNTNATITTPAFNQTSYTNTQTINASLVFSDNDRDSNNITFEWFKNNALIRRFTTNNYINGSNVSDILTTDQFTINDQIIVQTFAFDGEQNSTLLNSSTLTIQQAPTSPGNVTPIINSTYSLQTNLTDETIQVRFNASDVNTVDTLNYSIQWFKNNITDFTLTNIAVNNPGAAVENLHPANTTRRDTWKAQVLVCDNTNRCNSFANTSEILILNNQTSKAIITEPSNSTSTDETVTFRWKNGTDIDNDLITHILWVSNNSAFTQTTVFTTLFTNISAQTLGGGTYYWKIIEYDNEANSSDSDTFTFTVDTVSPIVTIVFPENTTYNSNDLPLEFNVNLNEDGSSVIYTLNDGINNISMSSTNNRNYNASNNSIESGSYTFKIYSNDTLGNRNDTASIAFSFSNVTITTPSTASAETGGAGSGSSSGGTYDFSLDKNLIDVEIKQGEIKRETINVLNTGNRNLNFDLSVDQIGRFVILSEDSFALEDDESKKIYADFFASENESAGIYAGRIVFDTIQVRRSINAILEILQKAPLFDTKSELNDLELARGQKLKTKLSLKDIGDLNKRVDVLIEYFINDFSGNEIKIEEETIGVYGSLDIEREFRIPTNLQPGDYLFYVKVSYLNSISTSGNRFTITKEPIFIGYVKDNPALFVILVVLVLLIIIKAKKKYKLPKLTIPRLNISNIFKKKNLDDVNIKTIKSCTVAYLSGEGLDNAEEAENELYWLLRSRGFDIDSPAILIYYDNPNENVKWDVCIPVNYEIEYDEFEVKTLYRARVASIIHHGNYKNVKNSIDKLLKWISDNNYEIVDNIRELHISEEETEIQIPIKSKYGFFKRLIKLFG